jgi:hypothetical protein
MTRGQFAMGSAAFLTVVFAGVLSTMWADRHFAPAAERMPSATSSACVSADGSWKNWVWANVPALSPKCQ